MGLSELVLPIYVATTENDPIGEFFGPVLGEASSYDVAVGYFSSAWLRDAAHGIARFAVNGGRARWIISPELSEEDFRRISEMSGAADATVKDVISRSYDTLFRQLTQHTREALGWLISDGVLTFKIGIPRNRLTGIMHAKQGLFSDASGRHVGFLGSYNLTGGAGTNWEAFSVFCDWTSDESAERIDAIRRSFDRMWDGHDPNLSIHDPSEADIEPFIREARQSARHYDLFPENVRPTPQVPPTFLSDGRLRDYQEEGIRRWFGNNGRGILHMATGTGKTVTALAAVTRLNDFIRGKDGSLCTLIAVPYQHLAEQWASEARAFGYDPILCYGGVQRWMSPAQGQLNALHAKARQQCMLITVNASLRDGPFQSVLKSVQTNLLFVGDEMHNLGASNALAALPAQARFRLGLSATPDRPGDEEGTHALKQYFGEIVLEFGLDKAISGGFLTRYFYHPVLIHLTDDEHDEYDQLSGEISRLFAQGNDPHEEGGDYLKRLLIKRARLIGKAANKLPTLLTLLVNQDSIHHTLIYCGDSKEAGEKYIDTALARIGQQLGLRANKFTSEESAQERKRLLTQFSAGDLQLLLAIRCLDEGVDVPMTQTAYIIASSANPKEFVQRRGRVLRKARGKKFAVIYDFIVTPDPARLAGSTDAGAERSLLKRELARFNEFAELSENHGEALQVMLDIKNRLNLLDQ